MYQGFPLEFVSLLRCPTDGGELSVAGTDNPSASYLVQAALKCNGCGSHYPVEDGIVRLMEKSALDKESAHEQSLRDKQAEAYDVSWEDSEWWRMELDPTLEALSPITRGSFLELGCGNGRYTVRIAATCKRLIAVDFSMASLHTLSRRADADWKMGLVQADVTRLRMQPQAFDGAMSTLMSNLPSQEHRRLMFKALIAALVPSGQFVFSAHYWNLKSRLRHTPQSGYYREGGIYRYMFKKSEILSETQAYFAKAQCRPIQIPVPLAGRLGLPVVKLSRLSERLPLLNMLGELLLVTAQNPQPK